MDSGAAKPVAPHHGLPGADAQHFADGLKPGNGPGLGAHRRRKHLQLRRGEELRGHTRQQELRIRDIPRYIKMIEQGKIDMKSMVTATYPIERTREAIQAVGDRTTLGAVITFA